jgi:hypothetical protein
MEEKRYLINKGINRPLGFRGLQAQYIWYFAGMVLLVIMTFSVLYLVKVSVFLDLPVSLTLGGLLITRIYRMSRKYGQYGMMKRRAGKAIPTGLRSHSRKCFTQLFVDHVGRTQ